MLELSGPGLFGAPGLKSLQLPSMWGVMYSFLFGFFPDPIFLPSEVSFRVRFSPMGMSWPHALNWVPSYVLEYNYAAKLLLARAVYITIGVSVTPALHFCVAHPKL